MKNISFLTAIILLQAAALPAQDSKALSQLSVIPAAAAVSEASPVIPAAAEPVPYVLKAAGNKQETAGEPAMKMWTALDLMTKFEQADIHVINGGTDSLKVESLSCAEDNYSACSMFVTLNGERKLIVTLDAAVKLIQALADNGFYQEEENWTVYVASAECRKTGTAYACTFQE